MTPTNKTVLYSTKHKRKCLFLARWGGDVLIYLGKDDYGIVEPHQLRKADESKPEVSS